MVFNSMSELKAYVMGAMDDCANICSKDMLDIMREEIDNSYNSYDPSHYVRTYDLMNTPQLVKADRNGMVVTFEDNGGWYSLVGATKGQHFFALYGLEGGTTWGRDGTNIYPFSVVRCYSEIPRVYRECLKAFGIPVI